MRSNNTPEFPLHSNTDSRIGSSGRKHCKECKPVSNTFALRVRRIISVTYATQDERNTTCGSCGHNKDNTASIARSRTSGSSLVGIASTCICLEFKYEWIRGGGGRGVAPPFDRVPPGVTLGLPRVDERPEVGGRKVVPRRPPPAPPVAPPAPAVALPLAPPPVALTVAPLTTVPVINLLSKLRSLCFGFDLIEEK